MRSRVLVAVLALALAAGACSDDSREVRTDATGSGGTAFVYALGEGLSEDQAAHVKEILENRIEALGVDEASVEVGDGEVRITIDPPPGVDADDVSRILGTTAELRFRPVLLNLGDVGDSGASGELAVTPAEDDQADATVVLEEDGPPPVLYQLGPTAVTGSIIEGADARLDNHGAWSVSLVLTSDGIGRFNDVAAECFATTLTCPTGQLAIVLDSVVKSAPLIREPSFERDQIQISGSFTEEDAKSLALVLRYGALPTSLTLRPTSP